MKKYIKDKKYNFIQERINNVDYSFFENNKNYEDIEIALDILGGYCNGNDFEQDKTSVMLILMNNNFLND